MSNSNHYAFWSGGHAAWWRGLQEEMARCRRQRETAQTDEERQELDDRLIELECQQQDAKKHSHGWLF